MWPQVRDLCLVSSVIESSKPLNGRFRSLTIFLTIYRSFTKSLYFHIRDFLKICSFQRFDCVSSKQLQLLLFPLLLKDDAKKWLNLLSVRSFTTWEQLSNVFLKRYFLAQKTNIMRKEIMKFKQLDSKSLYECWKRYESLILEFSHPGFSDWKRVQYFYERLRPQNR